MEWTEYFLKIAEVVKYPKSNNVIDVQFKYNLEIFILPHSFKTKYFVLMRN